MFERQVKNIKAGTRCQERTLAVCSSGEPGMVSVQPCKSHMTKVNNFQDPFNDNGRYRFYLSKL